VLGSVAIDIDELAVFSLQGDINLAADFRLEVEA